ncbi:MAG TPA: DUF4286 family protein [Ferruginibacter sp.]|nr:DUF4286 family protein [Ferruginibacter sp.]
MNTQENINDAVSPLGGGGGIVYNVTIKVDASIKEEWLAWVKEEHIPEVIATGCFTHATILRLLEADESDGPTYAIQYFAESKALYNRYIENFAGIMRQKSFDKWGNKFIAFRSVMQVVN